MPEPDARMLAELLRESMARGDQPALTLTSDSMAPLLRTGDQIRIAPAAVDGLQPGDIVTFIDDSDAVQLMTHRFWGSVRQADQTLIVTRGDRPLWFDRPFMAGRLVGRAVARLRHGRELRLDTGSGGWLNRRLAGLAGRDIAQLAGVERTELARIVTAVAGDPAGTAAAGSRTPDPARRLVHRTLLAAGFLLTGAADLYERF